MTLSKNLTEIINNAETDHLVRHQNSTHLPLPKEAKMVWLLVIGGFILLLVIYLMTAPVVLEVDSERDLYRVRFHRIASAGMRVTESSLLLDINVMGLKKPIDLLQPKSESGKTSRKQKPRTQKTKHRIVPFRKILAVIRSFKVNKCQVIIDTGDMPLNGKLFPVCYWLGLRSGKTFEMSFTGENVLRLEIQNSIARMLSAYFRA